MKTAKSTTFVYGDLEEYKLSVKLLDSAISKIQQATPVADTDPVLPMDLSAIRVLVAEDDKFAVDIIQEILHKLQISHIDIATDGVQAISRILKAEQPYDLVLCDWHMPGKTGLEVHRAMRNDKRFSQTVFILVSATSNSEQIRSAIQQGLNDYVVKPIDAEVLQRKILRAFEKSVQLTPL